MKVNGKTEEIQPEKEKNRTEESETDLSIKTGPPMYKPRDDSKPKKTLPTYDQSILASARDELWTKVSHMRILKRKKTREDLRPKNSKKMRRARKFAKTNGNYRDLDVIVEETEAELAELEGKTIKYEGINSSANGTEKAISDTDRTERTNSNTEGNTNTDITME